MYIVYWNVYWKERFSKLHLKITLYWESQALWACYVPADAAALSGSEDFESLSHTVS